MSIHVSLITVDELRSIATLANAASRDDVTPIINAIRYDSLVNGFAAVATDRYRVAELVATFTRADGRPTITREPKLRDGETLGEFAATIPPALFARAAKLMPRRTILPANVATVHIIHDEDAHTIAIRDSIHGIELSERTVLGSYPPVARLFPDHAVGYGPKPCEGGVPLRADYLATLAKLALPKPEREAAWTMWTQTTDSSKPAPVLFLIERDEYRLRYLVQPNLRLR